MALLRRTVAAALAASLFHATALRAGVLCAQSQSSRPERVEDAPSQSSRPERVEDARSGEISWTHTPSGHAQHHAAPEPAPHAPPATPPAPHSGHDAPAHCALMSACGLVATPAAAPTVTTAVPAPAAKPGAHNAAAPASALVAPEPPPPRG